MVTIQQRREVDRRVLFHTITNSEQRMPWGMHRINWYAAIGMAFVLGIRFANKHPEAARSYMGSWLRDHTEGADDIPINHEAAVSQIANPITQYLDEGTEQ